MAMVDTLGAAVSRSVPRPALDLLRLFAGLLPGGRGKSRLLRLLGWDVHDDARVSINLMWRIDRVSLGRGSRIGAFNVFRDLRLLELGPGVIVGHWVWVSAARPLRRLTPDGASLRVAEGAVITSRHVLDTSGGITIGRHSGIAGVRSTVLTHEVDIITMTQTVGPVVLGDHVVLNSDSRVAPGVRIASNVVVGMGATVVRDLAESYWLYGGVPAKKIAQLPPDAAYFAKATSDAIGPSV